MGIYINPKNMSKEKWLESNAKYTDFIPPSFDQSKETMVVCLVDNGPFTAAGIAYSEKELRDFAIPDGRMKMWFVVETSKLLEVEPSLKYELE